MKRLKHLLYLFSFIFLFIAVIGTNEAYGASYAKTIDVKLKSGQDATSEIQKALDEAAKAGTSKKQALVNIPAGTYYISKTLIIGSNTYLKLDKKTYIKKNKNSKDPVLYMLHSKNGSKGKYADTSNITVQGGVWDNEFYQYNSTTSGSVFMFSHTSKLKILDVTLCNSYGTHLIELGGVKNCTIKGCTLYGFKAAGSDVEKEAIQLDICHSKSIIDSGEPFDDTPCAQITVTNCEIYDYPRAIGSHMMVKGIYHQNIKITNNNLHDISAAAIYGYNYSRLTVSGNTIENALCGIQLKTDSVAKASILDRNSGVKAMTVSKNNFKIKITDNTINLTGNISKDLSDNGSSIGIFIYGSDTYPMKDATITKNIIKCNSSSIYLRYVGGTSIKGNYLDRNAEAATVDTTKFSEDAIKLLSCENASIINNHISTLTKTAFENGIALREKSKNAVISENEVNHTTKSGLGLYDNSSVSSGTGNTINNSGLNGITVMASTVNLSDTVISNSSAHGVSLLDSSSATLNNFTIENSANNGLNVGSNCKVYLVDGEVTGSGSKGINMMENTTLDADNVSISDNNGKGVDIGGGVNAILTRCDVTGNSANGIFIDGVNSDTTINLCTISDNQGNALQLKNGYVYIDDNIIKNNCLGENEGKAVAVFGGITGEIKNNTFSNRNVKSELWIASDAFISSLLDTVKRTQATGYRDRCGNTYS